MEEIFNDALRNRSENIIEYLRLGSVNVQDETGKTMLHYACLGNSIEVIQVLLEHGADLNVLDNRLESPIFIAVRNKLYGVCLQLIKNGANLNLVNNSGESLIFIATLSGQTKIVDLLLENQDYDLTITNLNHENVLFYAIKGRKEDLFLKFANLNPDLVYAKDYHNMNLLQASIKYNIFNLYKYLLKYISIYECDNDNNNASMYVAKYANSFITVDFLKLNPILVCKNKLGETVLDVLQQNTYDIAHLIETYQSSYRYISYLRTYPMHVAVISRDYEILIRYSYDKNKKDIFGTSILDLAKIVGDKNILNILSNK